MPRVANARNVSALCSLCQCRVILLFDRLGETNTENLAYLGIDLIGFSLIPDISTVYLFLSCLIIPTSYVDIATRISVTSDTFAWSLLVRVKRAFRDVSPKTSKRQHGGRNTRRGRLPRIRLCPSEA